MIKTLKYIYVPIGLLLACLMLNLMVIPVSAEQLLKEDFQRDRFDKVVDFFDYARAWAVLKGLPKPPDHWHANVYMTYVNRFGFQLLYAGLKNISLVNTAYLTIPMQTILMHYKTQEVNQDALVASSFLMIMGFNDSSTSLHTDSPDQNDNLWASFSLGVNLQELFPDADLPTFISESEIIPLTSSVNNEGEEIWTWGMKYTNLTAFWVTTDIVDEDRTETSKPFGLATYDELTFKYTLTLNPMEGTATLHKDYTIGHMHDLWIFGGWFLVWPIYNHYNSTGCYRYNAQVSDETVYEFLENHAVKMSIVEYQKVLLLDMDTYTTTDTGVDVSENEVDITDSSLSTYSADGEHICTQDFGAKPFYDLYNNHGDVISTGIEVVPRTYDVNGYARNRNLFQFQTSFQRYIPLILVGMYPQLYQRAKETITNVETADCLYVISYPTYHGYRIDHDPVLTAYFAPTQTVGTNVQGLILLIVIAIPVMVAIVLVRRRRTSILTIK